MKKIIDVKVSVQKQEIEKVKTEILAVGIFSDDKKLDKTVAALDKKIGGQIEKIKKLGDF